MDTNNPKLLKSHSLGNSLFTPLRALNRKQTVQHKSFGEENSFYSPESVIKFPEYQMLSNESDE